MSASSGGTTPFFVLTFAITWGLQIPAVLIGQGTLPGDPRWALPLAGLGLLGPLLAATFLTAREGGSRAVKALYSGLLRWRVHPAWYVVALAPPLLLAGMLVLLNLAGRQGPTAYLPAGGALAFAVVISVVEEIGWRGYALPRLQQRKGTFAAATSLGLLWYLWHLPMFAGQGVPLDLVFVMLLFFTGGSLFFAWIFNGSGGSTLLAVVAHLGVHLNNSHRALPDEVVPLVAHAVIYGGLGLLVTWRLAHGRRRSLKPG